MHINEKQKKHDKHQKNVFNIFRSLVILVFSLRVYTNSSLALSDWFHDWTMRCFVFINFSTNRTHEFSATHSNAFAATLRCIKLNVIKVMRHCYFNGISSAEHFQCEYNEQTNNNDAKDLSEDRACYEWGQHRTDWIVKWTIPSGKHCVITESVRLDF